MTQRQRTVTGIGHEIRQALERWRLHGFHSSRKSTVRVPRCTAQRQQQENTRTEVSDVAQQDGSCETSIQIMSSPFRSSAGAAK